MNNTNIKNSIPQETLNVVCTLLKPYVANISEENINNLATSGTNKKTNKTLLSTKEVCEYLSISYMTLLRIRKTGELSYIKTNPNRSGRALYELESVNKWIDSKRAC